MLSWLFDGFSFIAHLAGIGILTLLAYGGLILAVLAWGSRFHPAVKWPVTELAVILFGLMLAASGWSFSALHADKSKTIDRLQAALNEQVRQREEAERVMRKAQEAYAQRAQEIETLQETVDDYENALASGQVAACPADPDYTRGMRRIRIGASSDAPVARPRPRPALP